MKKLFIVPINLAESFEKLKSEIKDSHCELENGTEEAERFTEWIENQADNQLNEKL